MRTNAKTRETMPQEWIEFFKSYKGKKYFEDGGYKCCAYTPEHDGRGVVQTALRRSVGRYVFTFKEKDKNYLKSLGFSNVALINIFFNTCASMHGGMFIYDLEEMRGKHGKCYKYKWLVHTYGGKEKVKATVKRGVNEYYEVPLEFCKKLYDVWELPSVLCKSSLYSCAAWQYQKLTTKDNWGECAYDQISTWEDLPEWCFWKYMLPDGTIIKGREKQFEEWKQKVQNDPRYIPTHKC